MHHSNHPCCPCACPGGTFPYIAQPGDTFYALAKEFDISVQSIMNSNPGVDPRHLRTGQQICIPACGEDCNCGCECGCTCEDNLMAAQMNIALLRAQSPDQKASDEIYRNSSQTTRVVMLTGTEIMFSAAPVTFSGNYLCLYSLNEDYAYYIDAAIGGQRNLNVRDNFGIWHTFSYREPV